MNGSKFLWTTVLAQTRTDHDEDNVPGKRTALIGAFVESYPYNYSRQA